jgi:hAT family C-terminal dimerisation region
MKDDEINILNYWKKNIIVYLTLAMMTRDIFIVHVSIFPSESCFNSANRTLIDKHTKLGASLFEKFMWLKD